MLTSIKSGICAIVISSAVTTAAMAQVPVWDDPVIIDLVASRPAPVDAEHDLPTLRRTLITETRDEVWAARTEAKLLEALNVGMPVEGAADRRAVRCRRSVCEVTVMSRTDAAGAARRSAAFDAIARRTAYALGIDHRSSASVFDETAPSTQGILAYFTR